MCVFIRVCSGACMGACIRACMGASIILQIGEYLLNFIHLLSKFS